MKLPHQFFLHLIMIIAMTGCVRSANPVRQEGSKTAQIPIERSQDGTVVLVRVVDTDDARDATANASPTIAAVPATSTSPALPEHHQLSPKDVDIGAAKGFILKEENPVNWTNATNPKPITNQRFEATISSPILKMPAGDYGRTYFMQVVETSGDAANAKVVRNDVSSIDSRESAIALGTHIGLLFIPKLDAVITSTQVSFYPARLVSVDRYHGPSLAAVTDGLSIDAGIAGGSVIGNAPAQLGGRIAFTFGGGYTFGKGWAVKGGWTLFRDATQNDKLSYAPYFGMSYDLLSGIVSPSK